MSKSNPEWRKNFKKRWFLVIWNWIFFRVLSSLCNEIIADYNFWSSLVTKFMEFPFDFWPYFIYIGVGPRKAEAITTSAAYISLPTLRLHRQGIQLHSPESKMLYQTTRKIALISKNKSHHHNYFSTTFQGSKLFKV